MVLDQNPFEIELLSTNYSSPRCLEFYNNKLYIAENSQISFYDLSTQTKTVVINNLANRPLSLAVKNDILYYTSEKDVLQVNLNLPTEIDTFYKDLNSNIYGISVIGNEMYVDQTYGSSTKKIIKLNLSSPLNSLETVVEGIGSAIDINYYEGSLYFVSPLEPNNGQEGKIFKLSEQIITNTHFLESKDPIIYPNPAIESIQIKGISETELSISIFDQNGQHIRTVKRQSKLDVIDLSQGVYYFEIKDLKTNLNSSHKCNFC